MHFHPSFTRELSITRSHDAEHAAARARRASEALPQTGRLKPRRPRSTAPVGGCTEPARA